MKLKHILITWIVITQLSGIAMAAETSSDPFSLGNAKTFWDAQDAEFHETFFIISGLISFAVAAVIIFAGMANAASHAAQNSGSFQNPEKKSGSGTNMISIVFIVLGVILFLRVILPIFGF